MAALAAATLMTLLAAGGRSAQARGVPPLNLKRATATLNADLRTGRSPYFRRRDCVQIGDENRWKGLRRNAFEDAPFDYSPAGFRIVLEANAVNLPYNVVRRLRVLAKAGMLAQTRLSGGATAFTMTWRGYAASDEYGCFETAESGPSARIVSWSGMRENSVVLYNVVARVSPGKPVAWAKSRAFAEAFGPSTNRLGRRNTQFVLALGRHGYVVLSQDGRTVSTDRLDEDLLEIYIRRAGLVNAASIAHELQTELDGSLSNQARLCLPLPLPGEADDNDFYNAHRNRPGEARRTEAHFTYYNVPGAPLRMRVPVVRGYAKTLKLQALGLAKSTGFAATKFRTWPAAGAVRFTVDDKKLQGLLEHPSRCFMVGKLAVDKVLRVEPLEPWRRSSRFWARLKVVPAGAIGARAIAQYGNFRRMAEAGVGVQFTIQPTPRGLHYSGLIRLLRFDPDLSKISMPVVVDKKNASAGH